jgi:superfamily II DNA or RNA helicase
MRPDICNLIETRQLRSLDGQPVQQELPNSRSSRDWVEVIPATRGPEQATLEQQEQRENIRNCLQGMMASDRTPRPAQVEVLFQLVYGNDDLLLQAGTGYGKSIIFQFAGVLTEKLTGRETLTIMISPLNALTEQQVQLLPKPSCGVAITGQHNNDKATYQAISRGEYTHSQYLQIFEQFNDLQFSPTNFNFRTVYRTLLITDLTIEFSMYLPRVSMYAQLSRICYRPGAPSQ